jgi:hypothetical protein
MFYRVFFQENAKGPLIKHITKSFQKNKKHINKSILLNI